MDIPVAVEPPEVQIQAIASHHLSDRGTTVLSDRATTGFSGLIAVTTILLAVQFVTGVGAFPL